MSVAFDLDEQGEIFIVENLLWLRASVFAVLFKEIYAMMISFFVVFMFF